MRIGGDVAPVLCQHPQAETPGRRHAGEHDGVPRRGDQFDANQELLALSAVHASVGLFSAYPVSSSGTRTALAVSGRARSQVYSIVAMLLVVVVLLVTMQIATVAQLAEWRRYIVVGIFIVAAVVTPPDVASQLMLALPMCLLYEIGLVLGRLIERRRAA